MSRTGLMFGGAILILAVVASFVASSSPDGLERVAADLGFERHAATLYTAPIPDYTMPHVAGPISGSLAGVLGTVVVGALAWGAGRLLTTRRAR